ncbi:MAG TPA: MOSC domain-containing protein [Marinagarivorans sp.]
MKIISINTAEVQQLAIGDKSIASGIYKTPRKGAVAIGEFGLDGDNIVDTQVHGGKDQAVYLYSAEDYAWWSAQLGRDIPPGTFGENLTISGFHDGALRIGDQLLINDSVHLEITAPRVPCVKFAHKMSDPKFVKKFVAAERPGCYARVLKPGVVNVGDTLQWQTTAQDYATIKEVFVEWHKKAWSKEVAKKALASPISNIARGIIERRAGVAW